MNYSVVRGSQDYVYATVSDRRGEDLTTSAVELAIHRGPVGTWVPAVWENGEVRSTNPVTFSMPLGVYDVTLRLTDSPEIPRIRVGQIRVTN